MAGHALLPAHGLVHQQQQPLQQQQQQLPPPPQQQQQHAVCVRRIGYVSQSPWLMRGSVRDNVLLGQPYEPELMGEVSTRGVGVGKHKEEQSVIRKGC